MFQQRWTKLIEQILPPYDGASVKGRKKIFFFLHRFSKNSRKKIKKIFSTVFPFSKTAETLPINSLPVSLLGTGHCMPLYAGALIRSPMSGRKSQVSRQTQLCCPGGGGVSGSEGGRTRVPFFAEEMVFSRPPHVHDFVNEGYFFVPRNEVWVAKITLQSMKYTRLWRRATPEVTLAPGGASESAAAKQADDNKIYS